MHDLVTTLEAQHDLIVVLIQLLDRDVVAGGSVRRVGIDAVVLLRKAVAKRAATLALGSKELQHREGFARVEAILIGHVIELVEVAPPLGLLLTAMPAEQVGHEAARAFLIGPGSIGLVLRDAFCQWLGDGIDLLEPGSEILVGLSGLDRTPG